MPHLLVATEISTLQSTLRSHDTREAVRINLVAHTVPEEFLARKETAVDITDKVIESLEQQ